MQAARAALPEFDHLWHQAKPAPVRGSGRCAIIDPVLGFDRDSGATDTRLADEIANNIQARRLTVEWVLDTHPHADHLSAVAYLGDRLGAPTGIGERGALGVEQDRPRRGRALVQSQNQRFRHLAPLIQQAFAMVCAAWSAGSNHVFIRQA